MSGLIGNKNGLKLKDPDIRKKAYHKYCEWLALGKSSRSFTFEEGEYKCCGKTIESYIKDEKEFPAIHREFAFSKGYAVWEQVVEDSAKGKNKEANTASLQMLMRNKYDWDKAETSQNTHKDAVTDFSKQVRSEHLAQTEACDSDSE